MLVTVVLALLYPGVFIVGGHVLGSDNIGFRRAHLFRPIYLLTLAYLIGYLGEYERRSKRKLGFMLELPAAFRRGRAPGRALSRLMRRTLDHFGAQRGLLVLRDPESGRYFTWDLTSRGGRRRLGLRITDADPFPLPFAADTEGLLVKRDPTRVPRELEDLHQAVDRGYREVRHYLNVLREPRRPEADLWTALDRLVTEFSTRDRLGVRIVRPDSDPEITPATAHDLTQIVREALRNAVRHGRASQAVVKI